RALRPFITVLPGTNALNINTIPSQFYRCINVSNDLTPVDEARASRIEQEKPTAGHFTQTSEIDSSIQSVFGSGTEVDKDFAVKTELFWLTTRAKIGDQVRTGRSLLQRGTPLFTVVRRDEGF
ncbi:MAG: hypothetical protein EOO68_25460, partial [Moraxellaceae bacterium]